MVRLVPGNKISFRTVEPGDGVPISDYRSFIFDGQSTAGANSTNRKVKNDTTNKSNSSSCVNRGEKKMWRKFIMSRKFILALLITIFGGVSLGLHWLTGNEFVILASVVTGLYGAANIIQPKFEKDESDDKED